MVEKGDQMRTRARPKDWYERELKKDRRLFQKQMKKRGMTEKQLAEASMVTVRTVRKLLSGITQRPSLRVMTCLKEALFPFS